MRLVATFHITSQVVDSPAEPRQVRAELSRAPYLGRLISGAIFRTACLGYHPVRRRNFLIAAAVGCENVGYVFDKGASRRQNSLSWGINPWQSGVPRRRPRALAGQPGEVLIPTEVPQQVVPST